MDRERVIKRERVRGEREERDTERVIQRERGERESDRQRERE